MWIWHDLWIPRHFTCRTSSRRGPCRLHWVSELLNAEGSDWDYNKIVPVFNNADAEAIMKIKLSERRSEDVLAWHMEKSGVFSVSSAYRLGLDIQNSAQASASSSGALPGDRALWKGLWSLALPPKIRMFAWKFSKHIVNFLFFSHFSKGIHI